MTAVQNYFSHTMFYLYLAKNNPQVQSAMKKLRDIVTYFDKSTQAMDKLLEFQRTTEMAQYKNQPKEKKPLQDVVTRWWSTFRAIRRMRWLKKAIKWLIINGDITCTDLTDAEWCVLHQVEILLETMAYFQRVLEGESYVTGSLVPVAVYQIRKSYVEVIECQDSLEPVKDLARVLLTDFDKRYVPACATTGKVKYHREDRTGAGNRYVGIHQFFFFAALLDPRVAPMLPEMMTPEDYQLLKSDIIDAMLAKAKAINVKASDNTNQPTENSNSEENPEQAVIPQQTKRANKMSKMFRGLNTSGSPTANPNNERAELERYLNDALVGACPLHDDELNFNNPLKWWKQNAVKYAWVALLALDVQI